MPNKCISCVIFFSCINLFYFNPFFSHSSLSPSISYAHFLFLSLPVHTSFSFYLFPFSSLFLIHLYLLLTHNKILSQLCFFLLFQHTSNHFLSFYIYFLFNPITCLFFSLFFSFFSHSLILFSKANYKSYKPILIQIVNYY